MDPLEYSSSLENDLPDKARIQGIRLSDIETPALLIDKVAFEHNLAAAEAMLSGTGKNLRPHMKTHCTPALALRQLGPTVKGVTCATVNEAEAMVMAGIDNVLIANEIVTARKIERIISLTDKARVIVAVDALEPLRWFSLTASRAGKVVEVVVDVNVGLGRCGVRSPSEAKELAKTVSKTESVRFVGLMGYEGRMRASASDRAERIAQAFLTLAEAKAAIEEVGLCVEIVSASGTTTMREAVRDSTITDIQAGTYALMEPDLEDLDLPFQCAVSILATVISRSPGQIVLDVGRRSVGYDYGLPISLEPAGKTLTISDEHLILSWCGDLPPIGSQVRLRPTQNRTTFNLYDHAWLVQEDGLVTNRMPVARNRSL